MRKFCFALCLFIFFLITPPQANAISIESYNIYGDDEDNKLFSLSDVTSEYFVSNDKIEYSSVVSLTNFDFATPPIGSPETIVFTVIKGLEFGAIIDMAVGDTTKVTSGFQTYFTLLGSEGESATINFGLGGISSTEYWYAGTETIVSTSIAADVEIYEFEKNGNIFIDSYNEEIKYERHDEWGAIELNGSLESSLDYETSWIMDVGDVVIIGGIFESIVEASLPDLFDWGVVYTDAYNRFAWNVRATAITPAPVPEPSTFLLLGGGLASLAFYARRKRKE